MVLVIHLLLSVIGVLFYSAQVQAQTTLTNQCTDEDEKNWIDHDYAKFASSMNLCAVESLTIDSIAMKCLKEKLDDATESCLGCAIGVFNCIADYCVNYCVTVSAAQGADYFSPNCLKCLRGENTKQHNCIADATACSGWTEAFIFNCETCRQPLSNDIFPGIDGNIIWGVIGGLGGLFIIVTVACCCYCKKHAIHKDVGDQALPPLKPGQTAQPHSGFFNMIPMFHPFHHNQNVIALVPPPGLDGPGSSAESYPPLDTNGKMSFVGILDGSSSTSVGYQPQPQMMQSAQLLQPVQIQQQQQQMFIAPNQPMMMSPPAQSKPLSKLVVTYEFFGEQADELKVNVGTKVDGIEQIGEWWKCVNPATGEVGMIPASYVMLVPS